jgi:hypothetical protein
MPGITYRPKAKQYSEVLYVEPHSYILSGPSHCYIASMRQPALYPQKQLHLAG